MSEHYSEKYRKMAKAANERIRQFEKRGINSPAVQRAKAWLTMAGRNRFSETGKTESAAAMRQEMNFLENFLGRKTSTQKGYKEYREQVIETANDLYNLSDYGISESEYLDMFESLDEVVDRKSDIKEEKKRTYYGTVYIAALEAIKAKNKKETLSKSEIKELIAAFESQETFSKSAKAIGLKSSEINKILRSFG